ncbi:hypothetical protein EYC84_002930 [Monilinia fructicola]|uniref:Uncharacterized protein n=1 Tax=Monilinia fructicola TaxID=38448 RepID=A0A5M9JS33_MONFR|nr:hypothetical protein EYC84_002930 [Monilinia fructicola]
MAPANTGAKKQKKKWSKERSRTRPNTPSSSISPLPTDSPKICLKELEEKGQIKIVVKHHAGDIYTRAIKADDYIWGLKRPNWSQVEVIKAYWNGPLQLTTPTSPYDGTNPELPSTFALNGQEREGVGEQGREPALCEKAQRAGRRERSLKEASRLPSLCLGTNRSNLVPIRFPMIMPTK